VSTAVAEELQLFAALDDAQLLFRRIRPSGSITIDGTQSNVALAEVYGFIIKLLLIPPPRVVLPPDE